jgi:DNA-binding MarR family transcriptional regulator
MIDFSQLDKTIHETARLAIMTLLAARPEWTFPDLKQELQMSDGNLITHLRKLEEAGYLEMQKQPQLAGRSLTCCVLTPSGREAFARYLRLLEEIVKSIETVSLEAGTGGA